MFAATWWQAVSGKARAISVCCSKACFKKQLQSLAGKLNFCASVVYVCRVFSRRIIDALNRLKVDNHKVMLCGSIKADIPWWQSFMANFNRKSMLLDTIPVKSVFTDSCNLAAACGGVGGASLKVTSFTAAGNVTGHWCRNCILIQNKS